MTTQAGERLQTVQDAEKQVVTYLEAHPDFFENHSRLLETLRIPHASGNAISLIEHQVTRLRQQADQYREQLEQWTEVAKENEEVNGRMHRLTLSLIDAATFDEVLNALQDELHDEFRADAVELRLFSNTELPELSDPSSEQPPEVAAFRDFFASGRPLCGHLTEEQLGYLFGAQAEDIGSAVLIPLQAKTLLGMLAIGSRDAQRFHPDMGTDFLSRLGQIVARTLQGVSVPGA